MKTPGYESGFTLKILPKRLGEPLKRKVPTTCFVNSMSDLFHEDIPFEFIENVISVIEQANWHTFQILTKRAERMEDFFRNRQVPINAWLGVTVEDKKYGIPRIDNLRRINASIRFLSVEPLLEDLGQIDLTNIHWVIVGGESGTKAGPMCVEWVENIRLQCAEYEVAFFSNNGEDGEQMVKNEQRKRMVAN